MHAHKEWAAAGTPARRSFAPRPAGGPYRDTINAATMLGQSKTCHQRTMRLYFRGFSASTSPLSTALEGAAGFCRYVESAEHRPLEGFVFATPFNHLDRGQSAHGARAVRQHGHLEPASTAIYSAHFLMELLKAAGLPDGVINLVTDRAARSAIRCSRTAIWQASTSRAPRLFSMECGNPSATTSASTAPIRGWWARPAAKISSWPTPAPTNALVTATRGAFEYQARSAAPPAAYIPRTSGPR